MSKSEAKLLVREIVKVVHYQRVLVRFIQRNIDNSALSVRSNHFLYFFNAPEVNMHGLHLLSHQLTQNVESGLCGNFLDGATYPSKLLLDQVFVINVCFFGGPFLLEEFVET
jgi:hypothetical protein